jgi:hypothetical protein
VKRLTITRFAHRRDKWLGKKTRNPLQ